MSARLSGSRLQAEAPPAPHCLCRCPCALRAPKPSLNALPAGVRGCGTPKLPRPVCGLDPPHFEASCCGLDPRAVIPALEGSAAPQPILLSTEPALPGPTPLLQIPPPRTSSHRHTGIAAEARPGQGPSLHTPGGRGGWSQDGPALIAPWRAHRNFHIRLEDGQHRTEAPSDYSYEDTELKFQVFVPQERSQVSSSSLPQPSTATLGRLTQIPPLGA